MGYLGHVAFGKRMPGSGWGHGNRQVGGLPKPGANVEAQVPRYGRCPDEPALAETAPLASPRAPGAIRYHRHPQAPKFGGSREY